MNLNAYDVIIPKIDKTTSWIDIRVKLLLSREIKFRPFYTIGKRYNIETGEFDYYVALLDNKTDAAVTWKTRIDNYGRIKVNLKLIWEETSLKTFEHDVNINLVLIEHDDDGDIYKLDL